MRTMYRYLVFYDVECEGMEMICWGATIDDILPVVADDAKYRSLSVQAPYGYHVIDVMRDDVDGPWEIYAAHPEEIVGKLVALKEKR